MPVGLNWTLFSILMPTYITRFIQEYPTEFYRCPANTEGFEFNCVFCANFYKTKSACISHMKKCCRDEGMEYNNNLVIEDGTTVYDYHHSNTAKSMTIKNYIVANKLSLLSDLPSSQIRERIQAKLIENGFNREAHYLYTTSFLIYKFFFVATDEENAEFRVRCIEHIRNHIEHTLDHI